jgi:prolactin regulatory element-binding protein
MWDITAVTPVLMLQSKQLVTGINASSSSIRQGENKQCRLYSYGDDK